MDRASICQIDIYAFYFLSGLLALLFRTEWAQPISLIETNGLDNISGASYLSLLIFSLMVSVDEMEEATDSTLVLM